MTIGSAAFIAPQPKGLRAPGSGGVSAAGTSRRRRRTLNLPRTWGGSSAGRAPRSHRGGQGFDPPPLHHSIKEKAKAHASAFLLAERGCPYQFLLPAQRGEGGRRPDEGRSSHHSISTGCTLRTRQHMHWDSGRFRQRIEMLMQRLMQVGPRSRPKSHRGK